MNVSLSLDLLLYGLMVVGLNLVAHRIAPDFAGATLTLVIAGGLFIMFWGVLGLRGFRRRAWPIGTVLIVAVLLLVQAVKAWFAMQAGVVGLKPVAAILFLLLVLAIGQLVNLAQSGRHLGIKIGKDTNGASVKDRRQQHAQLELDE